MKNDAALWQRGMEWGKELLAPLPRSHAEAYRHELKYLISYADKAELAVRMAPVLHLDPHAKQGGYFIRSLYLTITGTPPTRRKTRASSCARSTASASTIAATGASSWSGRKSSAAGSTKKPPP